MKSTMPAWSLAPIAGTFLLLAAPATAGDRLTLAAGGGLAAISLDWPSKARWDNVWAEQASLDSQQKAGRGMAYEGSLGLRTGRHFGVVLALTQANRDTTLALDARIPHPFFLEQPRSVAGNASGRYRELASHLDLEWRRVAGAIELSIFAGPTLVRVETDLGKSVQVAESYPYDTATFVSAQTTRVRSAWGTGFNAGTGVAWLASRVVDLGIEARYSRAPVELAPAGGEKVELTAGGLQATARLRLRF